MVVVVWWWWCGGVVWWWWWMREKREYMHSKYRYTETHRQRKQLSAVPSKAKLTSSQTDKQTNKETKKQANSLRVRTAVRARNTRPGARRIRQCGCCAVLTNGAQRAVSRGERVLSRGTRCAIRGTAGRRQARRAQVARDLTRSIGKLAHRTRCA